MFKTTMPLFIQREEKGKLITEEKTIDLTIDTSVFSEQRWEDNFPKQAEKETLTNYIARIQKTKDKESLAYVLSSLKALYCLMKSSAFPDFESFASNFNLTDLNSLTKVVDRIKYIFNLALKSVTTPKN